MSINLEVLSKRKGSNHGGVCKVFSDSNYLFDGYVKYCARSEAGSFTNLTHQKQPVYEAMIFKMASELGLSVPKFYVIDNSDHNLGVVEGNDSGCDIKPGMPYYFVSELVEDDRSSASDVIKREAIYRDLLSVDDVVGRRHNYAVVDERVVYFDLGCSFVRAHNSVMDFPHGRMGRMLPDKDLRNVIKKLSRYSVKHNVNGSLIDLGEFLDFGFSLSLPVLGKKKDVSINNLIDQEEIDEIYGRLISAIDASKFLKRYKGMLHRNE